MPLLTTTAGPLDFVYEVAVPATTAPRGSIAFRADPGNVGLWQNIDGSTTGWREFLSNTSGVIGLNARTMYASVAFGSAAGDGSLMSPLDTVSAAIAAAVVAGATDANPFTVVIGNGTYVEDVVLAEGVYLQGASTQAIIVGSAGGFAVRTPLVVTTIGAGWEIRDVTLIGNGVGGAGLFILDPTGLQDREMGVSVTNCHIVSSATTSFGVIDDVGADGDVTLLDTQVVGSGIAATHASGSLQLVASVLQGAAALDFTGGSLQADASYFLGESLTTPCLHLAGVGFARINGGLIIATERCVHMDDPLCGLTVRGTQINTNGTGSALIDVDRGSIAIQSGTGLGDGTGIEVAAGATAQISDWSLRTNDQCAISDGAGAVIEASGGRWASEGTNDLPALHALNGGGLSFEAKTIVDLNAGLGVVALIEAGGAANLFDCSLSNLGGGGGVDLRVDGAGGTSLNIGLLEISTYSIINAPIVGMTDGDFLPGFQPGAGGLTLAGSPGGGPRPSKFMAYTQFEGQFFGAGPTADVTVTVTNVASGAVTTALQPAGLAVFNRVPLATPIFAMATEGLHITRGGVGTTGTDLQWRLV